MSGIEYPKGVDKSNEICLAEASWRGTPYRLRIGTSVYPSTEDIYLSLTGARHLQKRIAAAIKRLEKTRPGR